MVQTLPLCIGPDCITNENRALAKTLAEDSTPRTPSPVPADKGSVQMGGTVQPHK